MSASGVDKSNLREIGRDVLLVKGYDAERDTMILSIPPDVKPNRVSVDAIEHWMIYREHPTSARSSTCTRGSRARRRRRSTTRAAPWSSRRGRRPRARRHPTRAAPSSGQKNHGLTITGASLDEIFARIDGKSSATSPWTDAAHRRFVTRARIGAHVTRASG